MRDFINLTQRLDELTLPQSKEDAVLTLSRGGWTPIGSGAFAIVFAKPGADYVLKLFDSDDKAFRAYIDFAQRNADNPHFPRYYGRPVRITNDFYAIRTEPLEAYDGEFAYIAAYLSFENESYWDDPDDYWGNETSFYHAHYQTVMEWLRHQPKLRDALDRINAELLPRFRLDTKIDNIMRRGEMVVLTDPIANSYTDDD